AVVRRVLYRVLQEVQQQPPQQFFVAAYRNVSLARGGDGDPARDGKNGDRPAAFLDDVVEVEVNEVEWIGAGVGAREDQHVFDEPAEALCLHASNGERLAIF